MAFVLLGILNSQVEAAGGAGAYDLLETTVLGSSTTDVYFSSIPQTYKHLQIRITARNTSSFNTAIRVRPNYDSGLNYYTHRLRGYGSDIVSNSTSDIGRLDQLIITSTASANTFGAGILDILDYTNSSKFTTFRSLHGYSDPNSAGDSIQLCSILWRNTAAITDMQLNCWDGNFAAGSRFSLYGIKG